jgi:hypothetical protein
MDHLGLSEELSCHTSFVVKQASRADTVEDGARERTTHSGIPLRRARSELLAALNRKGVTIPHRQSHHISLHQLFTAFLEFLETPIAGCDPDLDGDLVLIEHQRDRLADELTVSLVRQLIDQKRDGPISAIRIDATFPLDPTLLNLPDTNQWFPSTDVEAIRSKAPQLPALAALIAGGAVATRIHVVRDRA